MKSVITSKFQTTIPKAIRDELSLKTNDTLEWKIEDGKMVIYSVKHSFLDHRNSIRIGQGDISRDIESARQERARNAQ